MNKKDLINLIISITLILSIGLVIGFSVGYYRTSANYFPEIQIVDEINPGIATIKLLEVKNGQLIGRISGQNARIIYSSDSILELQKESEFSIPLSQVNLQDFYVADTIPENTLYIASSQGKYYYSIFDKRAFNISEKNRLYFSSSGEAEKIGYLPSK
ncbi:hypothetical protein KKA95_00540 [Patescibacteria group bacterium]|nr:hypothetical protein [Patescibacteria group bacterium]